MNKKRDDQNATPDDLAASKGVELKEEQLDNISGAGDPIPTESVSFNYTKITWTYATDSTGSTDFQKK